MTMRRLIQLFLTFVLFVSPFSESFTERSFSFYLAPSAFVHPVQIVLSEEEVELLDILKRHFSERSIYLSEESVNKITRKVFKALDLMRLAVDMDLSEFQKNVMALDTTIEGYYSRVYPIVFENEPDFEEGSIGIGINILDTDGNIQRLLIHKKKKKSSRFKEISSDIFMEDHDFELRYSQSEKYESEWVSKIRGYKSARMRLPIPAGFIENYKKEIKKFFLGDESHSSVTQHVEALLLGPKRITFSEFLSHYPEAYGVLSQAYGDLSEKIEDKITIHSNSKEGEDKFIVTLFNRILQSIFINRLRSPVDGVADFSKRDGSNGPPTVNSLLQKFIAVIKQLEVETGYTPERLRFKNPPLKIFGEWLNRGAKDEFQLATSLLNHGFQLNQGALIFDVDMTLLKKGESFDSEEKPAIFYTLIELLKLGIPIRIISGGAAVKQYQRILKPLEEILEPNYLENLEMFTGTGSVRIYFDHEKGKFILDENYTPHLAGKKDYDLKQMFQQLELQIEQDLDLFLSPLIQAEKPRIQAERKFDFTDGEKILHAYAYSFDMASDSVPKTPFNLQLRDSRSATLHGWGLQAKKKDGMGMTVITTEGINWLKMAHNDFWKKNRYVIQRGTPLRLVILKYLEFLGKESQFKKHEIYSGFQLTPGGSSSIDITLKGLTKAMTAHYIFNKSRELKVPFELDASVYFGDEFIFDRDVSGNDISLSQDPRLRKLLKVHVGDRNLRLSAYEIFTRVSPDSFGNTLRAYSASIPSLYFIFDSLDGNAQILNHLDDAADRKKHAYNVSLFYHHHPILVVSSFADKPGGLLVTDLNVDLHESDSERSKVFLPTNYKYDLAAERYFVKGLRGWFQDKGVSLAGNGSLGSFLIRRMLTDEENLVLFREGHVPLWKIGYFAHLYLRGIRTMVVNKASARSTISPAFPLTPSRLVGDTIDYGTIYAYFKDSFPGKTLTHFLVHLNKSSGESIPDYWDQQQTAFDIAI